jgi:LuxR family maltose regulon positive regulatory protein
VETSLLTTKLYIPPPRPVLVSRSRLLERLQEGLDYSLVLVSAPAGFGKTTLLSEWAQQSTYRTCTVWLSLDEGDNDPIRFWDYFIAALQTLQPSYGEKILPLLHSSQPLSAELILNALINELSHANSHIFVVLDDYHLVESMQIHDGITYFIEHSPPNIHLVIASRSDPPLRLARFRGRAKMLEIHTDDLRFTQDETASLLKELKTPELSIEDITALNVRTEGWVIGLKMAALSLREQKDIPRFIVTFTGSQRYIMDYLMEEVLRKQSPKVREFLLKTSVLDRLTAPSCDSLTGWKDSQDILLNLERDHLFIVPLDESRQWWRYEHLFADLLKSELVTTCGREQVATLHRQASQWYEDNNLPDEAISHAIEARDWERTVGLVNIHYEARWKQGEFDTLLNWFEAVPQEILRKNLRLYGQYANLLAAKGQLDAAEDALSYLESTAHDTALDGQIALSRGFVYRHMGDNKRYLELSERAFALFPEDDILMRSRAASYITHVLHRLGPLQEAEEWAIKAFELGKQAGDIWVAMTALGFMGDIAAYQGKLKRAVEMYKMGIDYARQAGLERGAYSTLCRVQYIMNDLEAAAENAKLAVERGEYRGDKTGTIWGLFCQAQMLLAQADATGAAAAMHKLNQAARDPSLDLAWKADHIACCIMYAIQQGNLEGAISWSERLPDIDSMIPIDWHVPARLLLAQGKKKAAARLLQELYESTIRLGATLMVTQIRIYQAMAASNGESSLEFLTEALILAEKQGVIRFFVDEGKLLKPLLKNALSREITPGFTSKLLDIIEEEERQRQARKSVTVSLKPLSLLSKREIEVLRLLADDFPNQHIAEKLSVSLGTVKTHVHHIIEKLEVKDRRQAVRHAKDLKLI